jgi:hypothetical protein
MRNLNVVLLIVTFSCNFSQAKHVNILGTFINENGDTIDCEFKIPMAKTFEDDYRIHLVKIQHKVKAFEVGDGKKIMLKPQKIKAYEFGYQYRHYAFKSVNISSNQKEKKLFLQSSIDGTINLFFRSKEIRLRDISSVGSYNGNYYSNGGSTNSILIDFTYFKYYVQKDDGRTYLFSKKFYKTGLQELINDCPGVRDAYSTGIYTYKEFHKIILDYNKCK